MCEIGRETFTGRLWVAGLVCCVVLHKARCPAQTTKVFCITAEHLSARPFSLGLYPSHATSTSGSKSRSHNVCNARSLGVFTAFGCLADADNNGLRT